MLSIFSSRDARFVAIAILVLCALGVVALHTPADAFDTADSSFFSSGGVVPDTAPSAAASDVYAHANTQGLVVKARRE